MTTTIAGGSANVFPTPPTAPQAAATTSGSAADKAGISQTFDQFLTLLTTQLKNQDPTAPMDSTQFTNQLVGFSQVEQQIKTNDNLTKLMAMSQNSQTTLGLSYIGLTIGTEGSQFNFNAASDASIKILYNMPSAASVSKISVLDRNNNVVYTQDGDTSAGPHEFTWNGTDQSGQPVPAGNYQVRIGAIDGAQKAMTVQTVVPARVTGIQTADDGSIDLIVDGGRTVPMSTIRQATL
jgi:flagellar basal-body rod modification protein FlgD